VYEFWVLKGVRGEHEREFGVGDMELREKWRGRV
jgi:hypothetical protein